MTKPIAIVVMLLIVASSALPQSLTTESYSKAKAVLDRSVAAYGGTEELNAIANVSLQITGESVHRNQSRRPGDLDRTEYTAEIVIDLKNSRARQIQKGHYPGGFNWNNGFVVDAGNRTGFDLIRKTSNSPGAITPANFKASTRWLPQLVLLNVLERAQSLRYLGKADYDKRPHEVVDYVTNDGARLTLYIDQQTGLLSKFETLVTDSFSGDSLFDRFFNGDRTALSAEQQAGLAIFRGKGNCTACHVGPNFTDERLHNTGIAWRDRKLADPGAGRGDFKTPTLREIARSAPYMHDGSLATLEDVVEYYDRGGNRNPDLDPELRPLHLSADEKKNLASFLRSLSAR